MKKILISFILLLSLPVNAQEDVSFPDDFKFDAALLTTMKLAEVTDEVRQMGIDVNPGISSDKQLIGRLTDLKDLGGIVQVYYEVYMEVEEEYDDAGIVVIEFISPDALNAALPLLVLQSNLAYLTKDNYLILMWYDGGGTWGALRMMANYYMDKMNAVPYNIGDEEEMEEMEVIAD